MGKGLANFHWAYALKAEDNVASVLRFRMASEALTRARELRPDQAGLQDILDQCSIELAGGA
jgi:hypothetical protein